MFSKLTIIATPILLAGSVAANATRYGKVDVKVDGEIQGCLGPDALWNIDGNCETYKAWRVNNGGDENGPNDFVWSLQTVDGHPCNGSPMNCEEAWVAKPIYHGKYLNDSTELNMSKTFSTAQPEPCGVAQLLNRESNEVTEFPVTLVWRQVPKPQNAGKKRAARVQPTVTKKPSAGDASACTSTSTVAATTTNAVPHPFLSPPGTLKVVRGSAKAGCITSTGKWTLDETKCAVFQGVAVNHDFKLRTGDNWCFVENQQPSNHTVFKCAPDAEDSAQIWENTDRMLQNPLPAHNFNLEYWYATAPAKENKDVSILTDEAKVEWISMHYTYVDA